MKNISKIEDLRTSAAGPGQVFFACVDETGGCAAIGSGFQAARFSRIFLFLSPRGHPYKRGEASPRFETVKGVDASSPTEVWNEVIGKTGESGAVVDTSSFPDEAARTLELVIADNASQKPPRTIECCRYSRFLEKVGQSAELFSDHISEGLGESVRRKITVAGATREPVLITGDTGTGKSWLARVIHERSRPGGRFVEDNVAGMTQNLFEARLKGHVKGAFTDAVADSAGLLRAAHGGTLFLDEIGELPPEAQTQFLDLIRQEPGRVVFRPVGSDCDVFADTRIVAATNKDLKGAMERGELRRDLFYRFSQVIEMPSLADRIDRDAAVKDRIFDEMLFKFRLAYLCAMEREPDFAGGRKAFITKVFSRTWPGNIRQVENVLFEVFRRFFILCEEDAFSAAALKEIADEQARFEPARKSQADPGLYSSPLGGENEDLARAAVARKKYEAILDAVAAGYNDNGKFIPAKAARVYGCHPQTFLNLMKKFRIPPASN